MHGVPATTTGLRTARQISNVYQLGVPEYPRPLSLKAAIIQNSIAMACIIFIL